MKITYKQYVVFAFLVVCCVILSNAVVYKNIVDAVYLVVVVICAVRMYFIEKRDKSI